MDAVETNDLAKVVELLGTAADDGIGGVMLSEQLTQRVRELVIEKPQLLPLLDSLLDVPKNAHPQLKLLSVLGGAAVPKQVTKTVALATPVLEVSATIAELEKQATKAKPKIDARTASAKVEHQRVTTDKGRPTHEPRTFDAERFVEHARQHYIAVYSVLSKCHFTFQDNILTIYAENKFYKNKLDDTKYSPLLSQSLEAIGYNNVEIHTIPTAPPPSDKQAQAVAAIMGGGEEVSVDPT